jgi:hypothetical protein
MRFYVQDPHIDGLAVLDRQDSSMVISSFGDASQVALEALQTVAKALNAATDPTSQGSRTDAFKRVYSDLNRRVIEKLSEIIMESPQEGTQEKLMPVREHDELMREKQAKFDRMESAWRTEVIYHVLVSESRNI